MRRFLKPLDKTGYAALLTSFLAGLYIAVFYTSNNPTMLQQGSFLYICSVVTTPLVGLTILIYYPLQVAGKSRHAQTLVVFCISAFLVFLLRPALLDMAFISGFFGLFPGSQSMLANVLLVTIPSILLTVVFRRVIPAYAVALGVMTISAVVMNFGALMGDGAEAAAVAKLNPRLQSAALREKPNIYFILADGYGSLAYMDDQGIDVSNLTDHLSDNGFRLYEDTYSNYQPTLAAMPAMLDMDHHYYDITQGINFTEVSRAARIVTGGENNLSYILRQNGYAIQYIHHGNYLTLQGCSADTCFPPVDRLSGAKLVLSHMFKMELLSMEDLPWEATNLEQMREQVAALVDDDSSAPRFQYIHYFRPSHSPTQLWGTCDESSELEKYAQRVQRAGDDLREWIDEIIERDPDGVVIIAGDHGPFISKKCSSSAYIDNTSDYRDRAGALMAVRWPKSYDGKYDERIVSGVNLFRYVLASLAEDETPFLETVVPDDVFVRVGLKIFKILDNGKPLDTPEEYHKDGQPARGWVLRQNAPAAGRRVFPEGNPNGVRVIVEDGGTERWHLRVEVLQPPVRAGTTYTASFRARADGPRTVSFHVSKGQPTWSSLGLRETLDLTPEWQQFDFVFEATSSDELVRLVFDLGLNTLATEFSDVTLEPSNLP